MKIATLKQEMNQGDKATIEGKVTWAGEVKEYPGKEGTFKTQTLIVADGPKDDKYTNSIMCSFYADKHSWNYLKGKTVKVQGTVDVYNDKMSLKNCKLPDGDGGPASKPQESKPQNESKSDDTKYKALLCACTLHSSDKEIQAPDVITTAVYFETYLFGGLEPKKGKPDLPQEEIPNWDGRTEEEPPPQDF